MGGLPRPTLAARRPEMTSDMSREFKADVDSGGYSAAEHTVPITDEEFDAFVIAVEGQQHASDEH